MRVIRRYARAIAERFQPDKIILFGSYAYGTPHDDSDVDLLVIMPAWNQISQAVQIRWALAAPFPMDLIVRTPKEMKWRLEEGDSFMTEITSKGKVLYEKDNGEWVKGRGRLRDRKARQPRKIPLHDGFASTAAVTEKYLKGLMEEAGLTVPKTHDLDVLLRILRPSHPSCVRSRGLIFLSQFAVETRYPGDNASTRQATSYVALGGQGADDSP